MRKSRNCHVILEVEKGQRKITRQDKYCFIFAFFFYPICIVEGGTTKKKK